MQLDEIHFKSIGWGRKGKEKKPGKFWEKKKRSIKVLVGVWRISVMSNCNYSKFTVINVKWFSVFKLIGQWNEIE